MGLQTSGVITAEDINLELGRAASAPFSLTGSEERGLAGIPTGPISFEDFYGKANEVVVTNDVTLTDVNLFTLMGSPTVASTFTLINNGTIKASSATYALRTGGFPAGSVLIVENNGDIIGKGGNGGSDTLGGYAGGTAIYVEDDFELDNGSGNVFGGGGGGQGGRVFYAAAKSSNGTTYAYGGGGGAGQNVGARGATEITEQVEPDIIVGQLIDGTSGSSTTGGVGGQIEDTNSNVIAEGGVGGANGVSGGAVLSDGGASGTQKAQGVQGAAGKAIDLRGFTVNITAGNNSTQIKGAVS